MHRIGVIPKDAEIGSGSLHRSQARNGLVGVSDSIGIRILGNAPHTLNGSIICNELFNRIHIGTRGGHSDHDHFDADRLADAKVTVVAGRGAKEGDLFLAAPRARAIAHAVNHSAHDLVIHQIERGVSCNDEVFCRNIEQIRKESFCLGNAAEQAIIAAVDAILGVAIHARIHTVEQIVHQVKLVGAGLAAREVKGKTFCLGFFVFVFQFLQKRQLLGATHL